jgi:hypothetical protein
MNISGDLEDVIRNLIGKWHLKDEHIDEAYSLLVELHKLREEVHRLKRKLVLGAHE